MNLIPCSYLCIHQIDGYCQLNHPIPATGVITKGCCYYVPKNNNNKEPKEENRKVIY